MSERTDASLSSALRAWRVHAGSWLQLAAGTGLVSGLLLILQAWLLARSVDAVLFHGAGLAQVMPWLWGLLGLFLLRALLAWGAEQAAFQASAGVRLAVRGTLYRHVQRLGPVWLSGERSGDLVNALGDGVEALEAYYARYLPAVLLVVPVPLAILVFVVPGDWLAALILLLTAPLIPLFMMLVGKGAERRNQRQWRQLAWMSAHFLDMIQGLSTLRLFNASVREARLIARISDDYRRATMSVLRIAFLSSLVLEFFASVSIAIVAVLVGFRLYWGELDFLHGLFVLLLAPEFYLPLRNLGTQYHARMEAIGAAERLVGILDTPLPDKATRYGRMPDLHRATIRFEAVGFRYPDGRQGVQGLDLEIRPGETLALIGPSGAGKSTLVNLLLGFLQPQSGRILIGDTPLAEIDPAAWRRALAWLPQRPRLFPGTIADNIRLGVPDAGLPAVQAAAARAQARAFIAALPQGWETPVGEAGHGLSGGQVQRIALARAFLKGAPLVVLDEATAHLDRDSESRVLAALQTLAAETTLVMIAHRLHTVQSADRIAVLEDGRVVQTGTHAGLLQDSAQYRRWMQAAGLVT